jgi:hypothetical protein
VSKQKSSASSIVTSDGKTVLREYPKLNIRRGVLYQSIKEQDIDIHQLVLPKYFRESALEHAHNQMGQLGRDTTFNVLRERVYWSNMCSEVENWLRTCDRCIRRKSSTNVRTPLVSIHTTEPMELVCMDYLTLEMSRGGFQHILVITDHFTKYTVAVPTKNQTAKTTADILFNEFVVHLVCLVVCTRTKQRSLREVS